DQGLAAGAKFADAVARDLLKEAIATRQERDENAAAVVTASSASHVAIRFQAVNQFDGAVVLEGEALGECLDSGLAPYREAANGKQHQVLLGFEAYGAGFG